MITVTDLIALVLLILMLLYMSTPHGPVTFTRPPPTSDPPDLRAIPNERGDE